MPLPCTHLQAGLEHAPLRGVDHHRHARDLGLGRDQVQELRHRRLALDQRLVDVDVDDVGAVLDLLAGDGEAGVPVAGLQGLGELGRARDVRALADDDELRGGRAGRLWASASGPAQEMTQPLQAAQAHRRGAARAPCAAGRRARPWRSPRCAPGVDPQQPPTMLSQPLAAKSPSTRGHVGRRLVVAAERVRAGRRSGSRSCSSSAMAARAPRRTGRICAPAEGAVDADREGLGVARCSRRRPRSSGRRACGRRRR